MTKQGAEGDGVRVLREAVVIGDDSTAMECDLVAKFCLWSQLAETLRRLPHDACAASLDSIPASASPRRPVPVVQH